MGGIVHSGTFLLYLLLFLILIVLKPVFVTSKYVMFSTSTYRASLMHIVINLI